MVELVIGFLVLFSLATTALEGDKYPTIHHVYQHYRSLQRSMAPCPTDLPALKLLKHCSLAGLQKEFVIYNFHLLAPFLYPTFEGSAPFDIFKKN